jgi:hypothetical protein
MVDHHDNRHPRKNAIFPRNAWTCPLVLHFLDWTQRPDGVDPEWAEDGVYGAEMAFDMFHGVCDIDR